MNIENICKTILKTSSSQNNTINSGEKAMNFTILFGRPAFGKTTLLLQIAHEISKTGEVIFLSMENSKSYIYNRLQKMNMLNENIVINGITHIDINNVQKMLESHKNTKMIIIDYLQLTQGLDFLMKLHEITEIPILVSSQVDRFVLDNPFGLTTYTDIIYQLLHYDKISVETLKGIKKLCINQIQKCDGDIATAKNYNVNNEAFVDEYNLNGLARTYKFIWDAEKREFMDG